MTLEEIVEQFIQSVRAGENISIESYAARWPEYEEELKELLPITLVLEDAQQAELTKTVAMVPAGPVIPDTIGQYHVRRELGHGGMSAVYEVVDTTSNQTFALKVHKWPRAAREADILSKLSHENIIKVYDYGHVDDIYYTVMEFVDGGSLNHVDWQTLYTGKTFDQSLATIALQTAHALAYAHSHGVVHRDVKPGNIMLTKTGSVRLSDFDLAGGTNVIDAPPSGGTLKYMAPERLFNPQSPIANSPKIDQYAFGKTLAELLNENSDSTLNVIAKKCCNGNPAQRYETMDEVVEELTSWLNESEKTA